jgi:hypothetical protein
MAELMMKLAAIRRDAEREEPAPRFPWRLVVVVAAGLVALSVLLAGPCRSASAQTAAGRPQDPKEELRKRVYHLDPSGPVMLASFEIGLVTYDMTDPAKPVRTGELEVPGSVVSAALRGSTAWVCAGPYGLLAVDVSDPRRPREVGRLDTPGSAMEVAFLDTFGFLADGSMGIAVLDLSDPRKPKEIDRIDTTDYARGVAVAGRRLLTAEDRAGVGVFDLSDPAHPKPVTRVAVAGQARGIAVHAETAFVAAGTAGAAAIALAPRPRVEWALPTDDIARGVAVHRGGAGLVVADGIAGFKVVSLSDPRAGPRVVSSTRGPDSAAARVAVVGDRLYVAFDYAGFQVWDLSDPASPRMYGR